MAAIDKMLSRLDTDYIDLLLLHQQFGDYIGAWKDMEKAVAAGKVKSIGISNFESERLEELIAAATIKPSVLQVECHPYYQQNELKKRIASCGTVIESWYPIGHGDKGLLSRYLPNLRKSTERTMCRLFCAGIFRRERLYSRSQPIRSIFRIILIFLILS